MSAERSNDHTPEEALKEFWQSEFSKAKREATLDDPTSEVRHARFISSSNGKNRPPRRYKREVELIGYAKRHYAVSESNKDVLDRISKEVLEDIIPHDVDPYEELMDRLRRKNGR